MARGGINKAVVQQARQSLMARGEHPSIDAVRVELGNTGSKSTIHRYLKELEAHEPAGLNGVQSLSDQLAQLVQQLAVQLEQEAQAQLLTAQAAFEEQAGQLQIQLDLTQQALAAAHQQQEVQAAALQAESERLTESKASLQAEQLRNASLNQAVGELQVRLADKDEHLHSLEEKHRHARDALEHYRAATREQREQDQRRHEGQVQQLQVELRQVQQSVIIKQDELTRLHRDNERLMAEQRQAAVQLQLRDEHLEQRDAQIDGLRSMLSQVQGASDELRRQVSGQAQVLEQRQGICTEQARQLERLGAEVQRVNEAWQASREEVEALREKASVEAAPRLGKGPASDH
ncbi:DNA-binding protein [Pseudomonas sp.]|uniref:DNA-binding protein n=1 Tax=Pseudomonas sp. TaxID=306 RepID=UPI0028A86CC4|nr:DNA-binding protein [Pseudomonas sp.]